MNEEEKLAFLKEAIVRGELRHVRRNHELRQSRIMVTLDNISIPFDITDELARELDIFNRALPA